ncbi:nicotinate-nucleotide pyrophosphorylase [carboxylating] [Protopterus annectens]|uniref:nicotinate-nucleotide pyrophosphorylase [carboxylating] n=1 Tax=Protopterus annectens TaxID=7888 RepID=UPI001CFB6F38|nr:nicotinate-nucleotide pyrophosphorylase [carboxylating] [Protopterus annectens]
MANRTELSHLLQPIKLKKLIQDWLEEDTPSFDYGGFVVGEREESATLFCKSPGVLAGVPFFDVVFHELGCTVEWFYQEGSHLEPICHVATVRGKVRHLLLGERVALNCLARACGIASVANKLADLAKKARWHGEVAGTRKTTPGFRLVEKYAMLVGGVSTHRYDLSSMIMLKDNHVWSAGNITQAVKDARKVGGFSTKIEVECRTLDEARQAAEAGADVVMLDNLSSQSVQTASQTLKSEFPHLLVEASGGITEDNITSYFSPYVDIISLGAITQNFQVVDFSLKITKDRYDQSSNGSLSHSSTLSSAPPSNTSLGRRNFAF